jgi:multiple sugar transport system substrate-binding protein
MRKLSVLLSLLIALSILLTACSTPATPVVQEPVAPAEPAATAEPAAPAPTTAPAEPTTAPAAPPASASRTKIRWFVGLGAGSDEGTFAPQQAVADEFNASQDKIELVLEIIDNEAAYDTLATQIAAGNAPDIVGPVGIRGRDSFKGAWLDLQPLIDKYNYSLSDFDPALVEFYQVKEEGQLGIPFGIFPSFLIVNEDLFDEAGLPYPPSQYGEPYVDENGVEKEWNMETLREVAMKLTVDANGNDATSPDFDSEKIVQFGWMNQWTDPRGIGTFFGAGSLVDDNGKAQIPAEWADAWEWTYKGWWEDYFIPNGPYGGADFLQGPGGPFSSGNLAMVHLHLWYVAPWALGEAPYAWDLYATPSYNGTVTSKMHADTFGILKGSKNQELAFEVLSYMLSPEVAPKLLTIYGGMPARLSLQGDYFNTYGESNFPGQEINWDIVVESMAFADNPNHESYMPSFLEATDKYNEFWNYLANTPGVDLDAEILKLQSDLQKIFDAATN